MSGWVGSSSWRNPADGWDFPIRDVGAFRRCASNPLWPLARWWPLGKKWGVVLPSAVREAPRVLQSLVDMAPKYVLEQFLQQELLINITEHEVGAETGPTRPWEGDGAGPGEGLQEGVERSLRVWP